MMKMSNFELESHSLFLSFFQVHLKAPFILNGVCVKWKGYVDMERLDGVGCIEFDEETAKMEDEVLREQVEAYNRRVKEIEEHRKHQQRQIAAIMGQHQAVMAAAAAQAAAASSATSAPSTSPSAASGQPEANSSTLTGSSASTASSPPDHSTPPSMLVNDSQLNGNSSLIHPDLLNVRKHFFPLLEKKILW